MNSEGLLKTKIQLENQGLVFSWWPQMQIQSVYNQDKKAQGFYKEYTTFDKLLLTIEEKQIWTIKKADRQRIDAFELWCWRRLLRVPCTARRTNLSILKEINRLKE